MLISLLLCHIKGINRGKISIIYKSFADKRLVIKKPDFLLEQLNSRVRFIFALKLNERRTLTEPKKREFVIKSAMTDKTALIIYHPYDFKFAGSSILWFLCFWLPCYPVLKKKKQGMVTCAIFSSVYHIGIGLNSIKWGRCNKGYRLIFMFDLSDR